MEWARPHLSNFIGLVKGAASSRDFARLKTIGYLVLVDRPAPTLKMKERALMLSPVRQRLLPPLARRRHRL